MHHSKDDLDIPDDLPELGSDLVAALAGLDVDDFSHLGKEVCRMSATNSKDECNEL